LFGWNVRLPLATVKLLDTSTPASGIDGVLMVASSVNSSSGGHPRGRRGGFAYRTCAQQV